MEDVMTIGIYLLRFTGTDRVYIGQCKWSIEGRFKEHQCDFRKKKHSIKMNAAYAEFGMPTMEILAECSLEELNATENEAIEIFNAVDKGFNTLSTAEDSPTCNLFGEDNGNSKYTNSKIIEVFNMLVDTPTISLKEVAKSAGISYSRVLDISSGRCHLWLATVYPERHAALMALKGTRMPRARSAQSQGISYPDVQDPLGNVYSVTNTRAFAREHRLNDGHLGEVLNGKAKQHKGWRLVIKI